MQGVGDIEILTVMFPIWDPDPLMVILVEFTAIQEGSDVPDGISVKL